MKVALIGVGQAGGKITEALVKFDYTNEFDAIRAALAINSAKADLQSLEIPTLLVGQQHVKGHGVGGDNELGAQVMEDDIEVVMESLQAKIASEVDAIFVVAGLGGGTGSGGAPVLINHLQELYDVPIYALGILPGRNEGAIYQRNAGRSLKTMVREADTTLLVDNDAWAESGESIAEAFDEINDAIAHRIGLFLAAGESEDDVAEAVVDSSEIINTLAQGGIAALGYASAIPADEAGENVNTVTALVREAVYTRASLPDSSDADAALVMLAGRRELIPREGVEKARAWVEEETGSMQVRGGDFPLQSDRLAALVLLSGVEGSGRVEEFMERARQAQKDASEGSRTDPVEQFQSEELDDLF